MNHGRVRNQAIWAWFGMEQRVGSDPWVLLDQARAIVDAFRHAVVARQQLLRLRGRPWGGPPWVSSAQAVHVRRAIRARRGT